MDIINLTSRKVNKAGIEELTSNKFNKLKKLTSITEVVNQTEVFERVDKIVEMAEQHFDKKIIDLFNNTNQINNNEIINYIKVKKVLINPHPVLSEYLIPALRDKGIIPVYGVYNRDVKQDDNLTSHITYDLKGVIDI